MTDRRSKLLVRRAHDVDVADAAAFSRSSLARTLQAEAELHLLTLRGDGLVLGRFQRSVEAAATPSDAPETRAWTGAAGVGDRRDSGGPTLRSGAGIVWLQLALAHASALVPCEPSALLNRYVRPTLRALTRTAALSHYFGRDWIATARRPAAWIGFAHDASSGRAFVEAFLAVRTPFWLTDRASFAGKRPWTLSEAAGRELDDAKLVDALVDAHREAYDPSSVVVEGPLPSLSIDSAAAPAVDGTGAVAPSSVEPPWAVTVDEAIGRVSAGRDRSGNMRIGGEFMASVDAVEALERALRSLERPGQPPSRATIDAAVAETLGASNAVVFGIRDVGVVRDVLVEAYAR